MFQKVKHEEGIFILRTYCWNLQLDDWILTDRLRGPNLGPRNALLKKGYYTYQILGSCGFGR